MVCEWVRERERERESVCVVWCVRAYEHMLPRYTIYQQNVLITT